MSEPLPAPRSPFSGLIDLAAERVGGRALFANDEFFAPKENLLKPGRGVFVAGKYTDRGKWMDGWETRRRREPGHDWCVIRLGFPGVIRGVTVDTNHFTGNYPEACSLDAAWVARDPDPADAGAVPWTAVLPRSPLRGDAENEFPLTYSERVSHVRLNIHPDGGVARLRVWGEARPDWDAIAAAAGLVDLVAVGNGGVPVAASDRFFSDPLNLLIPGRPADMGDGWETRRRRGLGHDWVVVRLGRRGVPLEAEIDTTHFKGNYPESAGLAGCDAPAAESRAVPPDAAWRELLPRARLGPDARHRFPLAAGPPVTHVRLEIYPDGGVARFRLYGRIA